MIKNIQSVAMIRIVNPSADSGREQGAPGKPWSSEVTRVSAAPH